MLLAGTLTSCVQSGIWKVQVKQTTPVTSNIPIHAKNALSICLPRNLLWLPFCIQVRYRAYFLAVYYLGILSSPTEIPKSQSEAGFWSLGFDKVVSYGQMRIKEQKNKNVMKDSSTIWFTISSCWRLGKILVSGEGGEGWPQEREAECTNVLKAVWG